MENHDPSQTSEPQKPQQNTPAPQTPQSSQQSHAPQSGSNPVSGVIKDLNLDKRTIETIKWSAIMYTVASVIRTLASTYGFYFGGGYFGRWAKLMDVFPTSLLINEIIKGLIIGAIVGFLLSKFYSYVQIWNVKYLKSKLDTFFKLLFYPSLIGYIVPVLLSIVSAVAGLGLGFVILIIGDIFAGYLYAKVLTSKVGTMYPSPIAAPEAKK